MIYIFSFNYRVVYVFVHVWIGIASAKRRVNKLIDDDGNKKECKKRKKGIAGAVIFS